MATKPRRWPRVLAGIASSLVLVATGVAGAGAVAYRNIDDNISAQNISPLLSNRPSQATFEQGKPLNILVMGSDNRIGQSEDSAYGSPTAIEGARSDTTLLVHISADRKSAYAVSIPRDTLVDIPACVDANGAPTQALKNTRFNEAFSIGGAACTLRTVEDLTGVYIDHFVVVDFTGFKGVVDALDGVEVCVTKPVDDPLSGLKLPAGTSVVKGEDALAFVRARYTLGDGSDISRIDRQQAFLSSAIRKATSLQVLSNPVTAYRVLDQATQSLTTDPELASLANMQELALSLSDMKPSEIVFFTAPFVYNPDGATVSLDKPASELIWAAMRQDSPWPPPATVPQGQTEPLHASPGDIKVEVVNGTAIPGQAQKVAAAMVKAGYNVTGTGSYPTSDAVKNRILYPAGQEEAARTLAYALQTDDVRLDTTLTGSTITVVSGSAFTTVLPVVAEPLPAAASSATPSPSASASTPSGTSETGLSADTVVCS